jgi:hypothetical protein
MTVAMELARLDIKMGKAVDALASAIAIPHVH